MITLTLDEVREQGYAFYVEPVQIVDDEGTLVGTYTPSPEYRKKVYDEAWAMLSEEELAELERAADEPGGCTLEEILDRLRPLERELDDRCFH